MLGSFCVLICRQDRTYYSRYYYGGAIVNSWYLVPGRTYGIHKNLPGIYLLFFTNNIRSYLLWSTVIVFMTLTRKITPPVRI